MQVYKNGKLVLDTTNCDEVLNFLTKQLETTIIVDEDDRKSGPYYGRCQLIYLVLLELGIGWDVPHLDFYSFLEQRGVLELFLINVVQANGWVSFGEIITLSEIPREDFLLSMFVWRGSQPWQKFSDTWREYVLTIRN